MQVFDFVSNFTNIKELTFFVLLFCFQKGAHFVLYPMKVMRRHFLNMYNLFSLEILHMNTVTCIQMHVVWYMDSFK